MLVLFILVMTRLIVDAKREGEPPKLDGVGTFLSASGLGLIVLGVLQSSTWGLIQPKDSPIEPFGLSLAPFVIALGGFLVWCFVGWQRHREQSGADPLVHLSLLKVSELRAGLMGLFSQNLILMGIFFVVPLYLQLVLGMDALETGIKMLPVSITMFLTSAIGSRLSTRYTVRTIVRSGLIITVAATVLLLATVEPDLAEGSFALAMALLGVGVGLLASQLGNVVQSSVDASGRAEAGGLQYTGQQLGSSLGVALIGALVLAGLAGVFVSKIESDPAISSEISSQVSVAAEAGVDFVSSDQVKSAAEDAELDEATTTALVNNYEEAQLAALKAGLLAAALIALVSLATTRDLPHEPLTPRRKRPEGIAAA